MCASGSSVVLVHERLYSLELSDILALLLSCFAACQWVLAALLLFQDFDVCVSSVYGCCGTLEFLDAFSPGVAWYVHLGIRNCGKMRMLVLGNLCSRLQVVLVGLL